MAGRISAVKGRPNLIRLQCGHWQGISHQLPVTTGNNCTKPQQQPLAHVRLSFLFNLDIHRAWNALPVKQQTTVHTYQFWKLTEVPALYFRGMHAQPVPYEVDISTTQQSSHTAAAICLGCLNTWEPTSSVTPVKAPHIQKGWTNGQRAASQQMTQKQRSWQIHQTEKQSAQPTTEITCILIPSWHSQHGNKWHFFRVNSKHLLSQTNDFF